MNTLVTIVTAVLVSSAMPTPIIQDAVWANSLPIFFIPVLPGLAVTADLVKVVEVTATYVVNQPFVEPVIDVGEDERRIRYCGARCGLVVMTPGSQA